MVRNREIAAASDGAAWHALVVTGVELRPLAERDLDEVARVIDAQDTAWWGSPDGDLDDVRDEFARIARANGSLAVGARVAIADGTIVGMAALVGHGHTSVAVDPATAASTGALSALLAWLVEVGAGEIEAPSQDDQRRSLLADLGFVPVRSSFELERPGDVSDLPAPSWPEGIVPVPFRLGVDDEELHGMIYSFWTDVPGHTRRPIDEWRSLLLAGPWFDPDLVVVVRRDGGTGPLVGCALGRTFVGSVGWVSQLGVAPAARGRGLGRAILLEACHRLARRDVEVIGLGVEAENDRALGLYRSVGMAVAREWVHWSRA